MKPISDTYFNTIANIPLLTREQEQTLGAEIHGEDQVKAKQAMDTLVTSNLRLAAKIVAKDYWYFQDQDDLMSEATLGLHRAAEKFNPACGAKFSSYAVWWIRQYVTNYIERAPTIRLSGHTHEVLNKIRKVTDEISRDLGYEPSNEELHEITGVSVKRLEVYSGFKYSMIPLDSPYMFRGEGAEGQTLADTLEDFNAVRPDETTQTSCDSNTFSDILKTLSAREQEILAKRYGLTGGEPLHLEKIGQTLNITRERVRQIQEQALKKLRHKLALKENARRPQVSMN